MRRKKQYMSKLMRALRNADPVEHARSVPVCSAPPRTFSAERKPEIDMSSPALTMARAAGLGTAENMLPLQTVLSNALAGPAVQPAAGAAAFPAAVPVGTHHHYPVASQSFTTHPVALGVPMPGIGNVYQAIRMGMNAGSFYGWVVSGVPGAYSVGGMGAVLQRLHVLAHH